MFGNGLGDRIIIGAIRSRDSIPLNGGSPMPKRASIKVN